MSGRAKRADDAKLCAHLVVDAAERINDHLHAAANAVHGMAGLAYEADAEFWAEVADALHDLQRKVRYRHDAQRKLLGKLLGHPDGKV
jgi:hypothetical protein